MFGAIGRWFKAVMYLFTGQVDAARRELDGNPHVVRARYDEVIKDKTHRIQEYKNAIAGLIAPQEAKMAKVKALTEEVQKLERLKSGALAKAKERVAKLEGKSKEEIHSDEEYQSCLTAYKDFSSTLSEKQARVEELEKDIKQFAERIKDHKVQLQSLVRELEKVKDEAKEAVADIISSRQESELADQISGISEDGSAEQLVKLREIREQSKAEARISREVSGTDTKMQENEFLQYAKDHSAVDEFDALVGLAEKTDKGKASKDTSSAEKDLKLPE